MTPRRPILARAGALLACALLAAVPLARAAAPEAPPPADAPPPRPPADGSFLDRPKGEPVAIVVFEDLECPDCRAAHPKLAEVAAAEKVPLEIKDFPILRHPWAFPAAIFARYFEYLKPGLGLEFRRVVFEHQPDITPANLRDFAEQFAVGHGLELPAQVDPSGKLQDRVQADFDLGRAIGLSYVPLIFVIGPGKGAERFQEVKDVTQLADVVRRFKKKAGVR
jgi:protein-disulfide isomerase